MDLSDSEKAEEVSVLSLHFLFSSFTYCPFSSFTYCPFYYSHMPIRQYDSTEGRTQESDVDTLNEKKSDMPQDLVSVLKIVGLPQV